MLSNIIALSIRNKLLVALMLLALVAWGGYAATTLPLDAIPDVTNNQVQVITQSPALAAQEVEQLLTIPLELQLRTIPNVREIRSISRFGLSVITVVFEEDVDTYLTRQLVAEKLTTAQADLGAGLGTPTMAPITTGLGEIFQYSLEVDPKYKDQYSLSALRDMQDWIVKRQLAGTPGVVDVSSFGGYVRQYEVSVNPERLASAGVSLPELMQALQTGNSNTGGSYLERGPNAYFIRGEGRVESLDDIRQIVVKQVGSVPLLVGDVTTVQFGHAVRYGAMTRNGQGEAVGGIVLMLKGASSEATIKNVKTRVAQIEKALPPGVRVLPFLDRTKLIDKAIHTVSKNLLEGGVIVVIVLLVLLGNLRAGLVVAAMIPLCMLFALAMMKVFGVSANLMSLGALDFGLIVDGAVIIVEAMIFHLVHERKRAANETMDQVAQSAATRLMRSALFGQLIILIVYFPILSLTGVEGKMFRPMALTVSFAIIGAMILCLTYVPAVAAWALRKDIKEEGTLADRIMRTLHRGYDPIIRGALRIRPIIVGAAVALLAGAVVIFLQMGGEFIPQLDEGDFAVNVTLAPSSSLDQSIKTTTKVQKVLLREFPEIQQIVGKIGTSEIPTDPMSLEDSDQMVILKAQDEWTSAHSREELAGKMQEALAGIPGINLEFQQPIQMRFNELISGVKSDISIKIYGDDLEVLYEKANQAAVLIRPLAGVGDLKVEQIVGLPQMRVTYNRAKMARYGLRVEDLNTLLRASFAGDVAGQVYEKERRYDLVVRLDSARRTSLADLRRLYVDLPDGQKIPLEEVAQVQYRNAPTQISRDDAQRRINIGVNVRNRDIQSLVEEIQQKLTQGVKLPTGYTVVYGGEFENLQRAKARLTIAVPVSLLLIFTLLYLSFSSVKQAALIFTGIPLAAIGGVLALWMRGMPFSISAGVGFIALFGVAVLNGIVLVASLNELAAEGVRDVRERALRATSERFRPVLLTAAVASLGFLPMALSTSAGAEVQKPLATVVIGGLISATLLTLVVLPVLYTYFTKDGEPSPTAIPHPPAPSPPGEGEPNDFVQHARLAPPLPEGRGLGGGVSPLFLLLAVLSSLLLPQAATAQNTLGSTAGQPTLAPPTGPLSVGQALQAGLGQSLLVQSAALDVRRQQALNRSGYDVPRTVLDYQRGQISDASTDQSFNIIQQTAFPTLYAAQKRLLENQTGAAEQRARTQRRELTRVIRTDYYNLLIAYNRVQLLRRQDSLYRRAAYAARIRYQVGETNRLEQVAAEARMLELQNQLLTLLTDVQVQRQQLGVLLGYPTPVDVDTMANVVASISPADTAALSPDANPTLGLLRQEVTISAQQTKVEKLRRLPDLRVGYFNQSISRVGGYQVAQAGVAVPLLGGVQKARIAAARLGEQYATNQLNYYTVQLNSQLHTLRQQLARARASLTYYETVALPQARLVLSTAEKIFRAGDVEYVTYVVNTEPAWQIQQAYLDQVSRYNQLLFQIQALTGTEE
ncbi:CusA/CzcA family heavy metal efflux RND transporter [Hymenobacter defluvii]|uniref:CusA/CzcA family heavy metal efflux RND transporter n=1 Tax=Hymenobacter defluvii TaxID=2054411 RepID=A0ABS3TFS6_9BACT|nr:CusA/CzcA family heavy metal efflux RND transporter [Hymenobacter defluvii]MBO3272516.1 CusA/CzcA family heavy metal efflux RND transporter [Hymenobacter defluvii]